MQPEQLVVELSRWQFAATVLYHFLFVPLTIGLSFFLVAVELVYVTTGRTIYRDMARFWGKLFAINFALGVATGLTMEFEFGTNWSTFSRFVGDIFGAPLAIEGLMAFFLESTFVGLMLLGWERLSRVQHLLVTCLTALGTNLSALWILIANGFMQDPTGASFNPVMMRLELESFSDLIFSEDAQAKFVHTVSAGYMTGAFFVMGISAWYLRQKRHVEIALRSFRMASVYGLFAAIATISLGDALGFVDGTTQPMKLAAMEGLWETETPPASLNLFVIPDQEERRNRVELQVPWVLTPLVTHTLDTPIPGIKELVEQARQRIVNGIPAHLALQRLSDNPDDGLALEVFRRHEKDLGYARLLQRHAPDLTKATPEDIDKAAWDTVPQVSMVFWSFHFMFYMGMAMFAFSVLAVMLSFQRRLLDNRWFLRAAVWMIPLPFLVCEAGWLTAEVGRQPWTVYEILPTWLSASTHSVNYMIFSLSGFVLLYTIFMVIEMTLMLRAVRQGPDESWRGEDTAVAGTESHAAGDANSREAAG